MKKPRGVRLSVEQLEVREMLSVTLANPGTQNSYDGQSVSLSLAVSSSADGGVSYSATGLPPGLNVNSGGDPVSLTNPGTQTNYDGDMVTLPLTASDAEGNPLIYSASNLPSGLSVDPNSGIISGTIAGNADLYSAYSVTITATDSTNAASASQPFTWTVNNPVSLANPGAQTNFDGDTVNLPLTATDAEGNTLTFSATGLPSGLSIDPDSGVISGTIAGSADAGGPYSVTITATDNTIGASASQPFTWTVNDPVSLTSPGDQTNYDGDTVNLPLTATDAEGNTLSFAATGLPSGLTINSSTGVISGTIAGNADAAGPYSVTVTATDSTAGASLSQPFNWTVNNPVSLTNPGTQTNYDGDTVNLPLTASDAEGNTLTFSATGLPSGLSIDSGTGAISGSIAGNADAAGPYSVTVTATDSTAGASASQPFTWTVNNPVSLTSPGNQTNYDGDTVSLPLTASDAEGDTLSFTANGLPSGLSIDSGTGAISGSIAGNADAGSPYSATVTATDNAAAVSASQTFSWAIAQPTVTLTDPGDQNNYDGATDALNVSASDSAGHALAFTATGLPSGLAIDPNSGDITGTIAGNADTDGPYTVTVTATDNAAEMSATQTFTWTVNNPVSVTNPGPQTNYDGDNVSVPVTASDAAGNSLGFSETGLPPGLSIDPTSGIITGTIASDADAGGPYSVTVTATDCTADASASQTFSWAIAQPTVAVASPLDHDNLDGDSVDVAIFATDTASHSLTYSASGLPSGLSIDSSTGVISGTIGATADTDSPYSVTVTADDSAADVSGSTMFNWEVDPLVTVAAPGDQTNCEGDSPTLSVLAFDAAGGILSYTASGLPSGLSIDSGTGAISGTIASGAMEDSPYSVTVTATDSSADVSASQTFSWNVVSLNFVNPGDQANLDADAVSLALQGSTSSSDTLSFSAAGLPSGLSINSSTGVISGTIADDADGSSPYSVTVTLADATGDTSASQTFSWSVAAPTTYDLPLSTTPNTPITEIDITQSSNSPDDPSMTTTIVSGPSNGMLTENDDGTYTYTPNSGWTGTDTFTFTVTNGDVTSNTSTATISVAPDVPTIGGNLSYTDLPGQALTLDDLMTNGSDPDGNPYTAVIVSGPSDGTLALNSNGVEVYTPNSGFTGTDSFTYELSNGWRTSSTATVSISVSASAPLVVNTVTEQPAENQPLTIAPSSLLTKDMSASDDSLSLCSFTQPADGTLTVDRSDNLVYTPNSGYTGADSFSCLVTDGTNFATETVDLEIGAGNQYFVQLPANPGASAVPVATVRQIVEAVNRNSGFGFGSRANVTGLGAEVLTRVKDNPNAARIQFRLTQADLLNDTAITAQNLSDLTGAVSAAISGANPGATAISVQPYAVVIVNVTSNGQMRTVVVNIQLWFDYTYTIPGPPATTFQQDGYGVIQRNYGSTFNINQASITINPS